MHNLGFSGMKSLDHVRSLSRPLSEAVKASMESTPRPSSSDTLKLTAEKLIKEQASLKTDLEMAHTKLIRASENLHMVATKLQAAVNENANLRAKQAEDLKLWKGLDSKLSSTKVLCDQLTETLQQLAGQTCKAEEDRKFFEEKLLDISKAFEDFNFHINDLSAKLESAGNRIRTGEQKVLELQYQEEVERTFIDEQCTINKVVEEKDILIIQLQDAVCENKKNLQAVESQLHEVQHELTSKEEICCCLRATQEVLVREKNGLQCHNTDLESRIDRSVQEIKELQDVLYGLMAKVVELDKEALIVSGSYTELISAYGTYCNLVQQEKDLVSKIAQGKLAKLHSQLLNIGSENDAIRAEVEELKGKILDLQKAQEFVMVQHADECCLAEDKIRRLETEVETLVSKKNESENLAADLREKVKYLLEASSLTENQMQDLLHKIARLESENQTLKEKVQSVFQERAEETGGLRDEILKRDQHTESLENQIMELRNIINEKEQLHISFLDREIQSEEQKSEILASLAAAEGKLAEERKQFEQMLEGKKLELSKHLQELSQRNDQAVNEIRRKYEEEKVEIATTEKEKADKLMKEMETKCGDKILEQKEEAQQYLMRVKEEHVSMVSKIQKKKIWRTHRYLMIQRPRFLLLLRNTEVFKRRRMEWVKKKRIKEGIIVKNSWLSGLYIEGTIGNRKLKVLVDTGCTGNYISSKFISKVGWKIEEHDTVIVDGGGNRDNLSQRCRDLVIKMGNLVTTFDAAVLTSFDVSYCDLLLGLQWLVTLGDVIIDFGQYSMRLLDSTPPLPLKNGDTYPVELYLEARVGAQKHMIFIDSGLECNLINRSVAESLDVEVGNFSTPFFAVTATGERLDISDYCTIRAKVQGKFITFNAAIVSDFSEPMALGIEWLRTLGPIHWNFNDRQMSFTLNGVAHNFQCVGKVERY